MAKHDGTPGKKPFHHGDLKDALIEASFAQLRDTGIRGFSVAQVARSLGVSTAAPYRHFADRAELVATVASVAARELLLEMKESVDRAGQDPILRLATTAGAYVRFVAERGVGVDVIYATELRNVAGGRLVDAGQQLTGYLLDVADELPVPSMQQTLRLLDRHVAIAHGYAMLYRDGFYRERVDNLEGVVRFAEEASTDMLRGYLVRLDGE